MSQTISKHIGEGFGKGELYAALAYDSSDVFGGMRIKQLRFVPAAGKNVIVIDESSYSAGLLKIHSHQLADGVEWANEFKGEFLSTSGTMDGIAAHFHMAATGTGVMRSIIGVAYLDAGITLSGTAATGSWISGGLFSCGLAATSVLNGTAVLALGSYSEVASAITSTLTTVKHVAAICGTGKLLVKPTTGECSLVYLVQAAGATTINQAIYIEGGATVDSFLTIDVAASGKAISTCTSNMGTAATSHALHIKIGAADGYIPVYDNNTWS